MIHATLRGKRYRIVARPLQRGTAGLCDDPAGDDREIVIRTRMPAAKLLNTVIHETLHAMQWGMKEREVERTADAIARVLLRLGVKLDCGEAYRRLGDE